MLKTRPSIQGRRSACTGSPQGKHAKRPHASRSVPFSLAFSGGGKDPPLAGSAMQVTRDLQIIPVGMGVNSTCELIRRACGFL